MKYQKQILSKVVFLGIVLLTSCSEDYFEPMPVVSATEGLRISIGEPLTRAANADAILDEMRLYCFDRSALGGPEPTAGTSSSYAPAGIANPMTPFHHIVQGLTKSGMILHTNQMRVGKWDVAMVSPQGATFTTPVAARRADQLLMYTFDPTENGGQAHEFYHNYCRIPEITVSNHPYLNASVSRNVAKVRVVVERAVDVSTNTRSHSVAIDGVPRYISWAGTLLKNNSGNFTSDKDAFDVFADGTLEFINHFSFSPATEAGTYNSDTIDYIIPAYRGSDFWQINSSNNTLELNPNPTDTITRKITLAVNFYKASGGNFTKRVTIPRVPQCNKILLLKVRMNDVNVEVKTDVLPWATTEVDGSVGGAYLNVSKTETEVYDGSVSRVYFWSNQPAGSVYVANAGKTGADAPIADVNTIFTRLAGATATNLHYDATTHEGYIDINQANTSTALANQITKIYLNAGGLKHEIIVKQAVTAQAARNITTPYVGTFHRASQTGERIVTWNYSGDWNAVVEGPAKDEVLIDRQPSPWFSSGVLYTAKFGEPEQAVVSNWGGSVSGTGRIYFRVGWKTSHASSESTPARYATIVVRQGLTPGSGSVIQTLYLRQGEGADYLMRTSDTGGGVNRTKVAKISPFNLTDVSMPTSGGRQLPVHGGVFTQYPSQAGVHFQWANFTNRRYAYHPEAPTGAVTPWNSVNPIEYWEDLKDEFELCPTGYRRINNGETGDLSSGAIAGSELWQSLWLTPHTGGADNSQSGYYADGFFDRQSIDDALGSTNGLLSRVSFGTMVAYRGLLFFNPQSRASVFFPASGYRDGTNGALNDAGTRGYYWSSSSSIDSGLENPAGGSTNLNVKAFTRTWSRSYGVNIRCAKE